MNLLILVLATGVLILGCAANIEKKDPIKPNKSLVSVNYDIRSSESIEKYHALSQMKANEVCKTWGNFSGVRLGIPKIKCLKFGFDRCQIMNVTQRYECKSLKDTYEDFMRDL